MPRSLWSGSLSFGLVNVPVALFSAARDLDVHFHQLHAKDGARIETRRLRAAVVGEVDYADIGHAYAQGSGKTVVLTGAELDAIAPERTRTIEIQSFVETCAIDQAVKLIAALGADFDRSSYRDDYNKLLRKTMAELKG
jgi:DNA end-binding protein Ku